MGSCLTLTSVVRLKAKNPHDAAQIARILPFIKKACSGDDEKDALIVADAIDDLVKTLGLKSSLREIGVGEDQIPKIVKMATGLSEGELFDDVSNASEAPTVTQCQYLITNRYRLWDT